MNSLRSSALKLYLLGTLGQIALVCLVVFFLRQSGTTVDYTTTIGIVAIIVGGISSAQWGAIVAIKYKKIEKLSFSYILPFTKFFIYYLWRECNYNTLVYSNNNVC